MLFKYIHLRKKKRKYSRIYKYKIANRIRRQRFPKRNSRDHARCSHPGVPRHLPDGNVNAFPKPQDRGSSSNLVG